MYEVYKPKEKLRFKPPLYILQEIPGMCHIFLSIEAPALEAVLYRI